MTIRLPRALYERLRKLGFDRRVAMSVIMVQALTDYLGKEGE
jgi:predicted transcriptional regulator